MQPHNHRRIGSVHERSNEHYSYPVDFNTTPAAIPSSAFVHPDHRSYCHFSEYYPLGQNILPHVIHRPFPPLSIVDSVSLHSHQPWPDLADYFKVIELPGEISNRFLHATSNLVPALAALHGVVLNYVTLVADNRVRTDSHEQWYITGVDAWRIIKGEQLPGIKIRIQRYFSDKNSALRLFLIRLLPNAINSRGFSDDQIPGLCDYAAKLCNGNWVAHANGGITFDTETSHFAFIPIDSLTSLAGHITDDIQIYPLENTLLSPVSPTVACALNYYGLTITTAYTRTSYYPSDAWLKTSYRLGSAINVLDCRKPLGIDHALYLRHLMLNEPGHDSLIHLIDRHVSHLNTLPANAQADVPLAADSSAVSQALANRPLGVTMRESDNKMSGIPIAVNPSFAVKKGLLETNSQNFHDPIDKEKVATIHSDPQKIQRVSSQDSTDISVAPNADTLSPIVKDESVDESVKSLPPCDPPLKMQDSDHYKSNCSPSINKTTKPVLSNKHHKHQKNLLTSIELESLNSCESSVKVRKWARAQTAWSASLVEQIKKEASLSVRATLCAYLIEYECDPFSDYQIFDGLLKFSEVISIYMQHISNESHDLTFSITKHSLDLLSKYQVNHNPDHIKNKLIQYLMNNHDEVARLFANSPSKMWSSEEKECLKCYFVSTVERTLTFFNEMWRAGKLPTHLVDITYYEKALLSCEDKIFLDQLLINSDKAIHQESAVLRYRQLMPLFLKLNDTEPAWTEIERLISSAKRRKNHDLQQLKLELNMDSHIDALCKTQGSCWYFVKHDDPPALLRELSSFPSYQSWMIKLKTMLADFSEELNQYKNVSSIADEVISHYSALLSHFLFISVTSSRLDNQTESLFNKIANTKINGFFIHQHIEYFLTRLAIQDHQSVFFNSPFEATVRKVVYELARRVQLNDDSTIMIESALLNFRLARYPFMHNKGQALESITTSFRHLAPWVPVYAVHLCDFARFDKAEDHNAFLSSVPHDFVATLLSIESNHPLEQFAQIVLALYFGDGKDLTVDDRLVNVMNDLQGVLVHTSLNKFVDGDSIKECLLMKMYDRFSKVPDDYLSLWSLNVRDAFNRLQAQDMKTHDNLYGEV